MEEKHGEKGYGKKDWKEKSRRKMKFKKSDWKLLIEFIIIICILLIFNNE